MTWLVALLAGAGVFLLAVGTGGRTMAVALEPYLEPRPEEDEPRRLAFSIPAGAPVAALGGAFLGLLVAQGDLFLAGGSRSTVALAALGAGGGWVLWSMHETNARERRARRLQHELPVIADAMSLHVVAGESINGAIRSIVDETNGVAAQELTGVIEAQESGMGLPEALGDASRHTAHRDATRLYETLSHAHTTGGRLAEALGDLAVDYRAGLERDLVSEGGKRAIATYGPVLVLMVPAALIFLIYPTLLGLRALSGAP
jgi:pilus assembly protein TadC